MFVTTAFTIGLLVGRSYAQTCTELVPTSAPPVKLYRLSDGTLQMDSITFTLSRPVGYQNAASDWVKWIFETDWYVQDLDDDDATPDNVPVFKAVSQWNENGYVTWQRYGNKQVTISLNEQVADPDSALWKFWGIPTLKAPLNVKVAFRWRHESLPCTSEFKYIVNVFGYKLDSRGRWVPESYNFCPEAFIVGRKPLITLQEQANGTFTMAPVSFRLSRPRGYQNRRFNDVDWKFESNWNTNTYGTSLTDFRPVFRVNPDPLRWIRFGFKTVTLSLQQPLPIVVLANTMGFRMRLVVPATNDAGCQGTGTFSTVLPVIAMDKNGNTIDWNTYTTQFTPLKKRSLSSGSGLDKRQYGPNCVTLCRASGASWAQCNSVCK